MIDLIIIRGLPGSGKSTLAKTMSERVHCEADKYFETMNGYEFDGSKIRLAHIWCQESVRLNINKHRLVVVSNTFCKKWEMQPYIDMCNEMGKTYEIVTCTGNYQNIHNVPESVIERMKANWEN